MYYIEFLNKKNITTSTIFITPSNPSNQLRTNSTTTGVMKRNLPFLFQLVSCANEKLILKPYKHLVLLNTNIKVSLLLLFQHCSNIFIPQLTEHKMWFKENERWRVQSFDIVFFLKAFGDRLKNKWWLFLLKNCSVQQKNWFNFLLKTFCNWPNNLYLWKMKIQQLVEESILQLAKKNWTMVIFAKKKNLWWSPRSFSPSAFASGPAWWWRALCL